MAPVQRQVFSVHAHWRRAMRTTIYLISQPYLSTGQLSQLRVELASRTDGSSELVRLERDGASLWTVLDRVADRDAREIVLRPLGLPSARSLLNWLPGAAGEWLLKRGNHAPKLWITEDLSGLDAVLDGIARADVTLRPIYPTERGADGKGWDAPPAHQHHVLVCTGPRCHLRDAPDLLGLMKAEIARVGLTKTCLVSSTGCLFPCNAGPVVIHYPKGHWYQLPDAAAIRAFVQAALQNDHLLPDYRTFQTGENEHVP